MSDRTPAEVFPPGEFIREELEARGWRQADLAEILDRPAPVVNGILSGKTGISPDTARGLAAAFGTDPELWLNLDAIYQLSKVRQESSTGIARRARLYERAPIREMIRRGWIESSRNVEVLEQQVLTFFGIRTLDEEPVLWHAARRGTSYADLPRPVEAWLVRSRSLAASVSAKTFRPDNADVALAGLQALLEDREEVRRVPTALAEAGIRMLIVEHLPKTRIDGASFWLDASSPVVALSIRYDRIDYFWFTLMHELAHIISRDGCNSNVPLDEDLIKSMKDRDRPAYERKADQWAARFLVPQDELEDFILRVDPLYSTKRIEGFARRMGVHPGIIVGQLQFRDKLPYTHHRHFLEPVRSILVESALTDGWGHSN